MKNDPISGVQKRLKATMARIRAQCAANEAEKREKAAALRATDEHPTAEDYRNRAQRAEQALAERDAEIARLRKYIADQANSFNIAGSHYDAAITALDGMVHSIKQGARQALRGDYRSATNAE